ncbi:Tex-like protein [Emticicia oligotrophica DSM 17448]|uniref:Tex-like protein n=1 Tax=Emticicia oligotrophica (strain DSM 17448 / CIP 109782 / MTCC 6937 / GPTSA100-15) TaxID=929562 RepID=A0ABN4AR98_EMTOG|nr:Tex family protein [Emticicia oligotrophica]AFK05018.1 Tex-like protein [Emticicia oligotrophica DSM 17448]
MTPKQIQIIAQTVGVSEKSIQNTINLFEEGATVPFISRYRKEMTGSMDEVQIANTKELYNKFQEADKRREAIIKSIEEQGKMTPELLNKLKNALYLNELEDLYLPYKQKRKTRAIIAIEKGLEPLAKIIFAQKDRNIEAIAEKYLNEQVENVNDALQGARDIMAEWINEDIQARNAVRKLFEREAIITSKVKKGKKEEGIKYQDYYDFSEPLSKIPSHRLLALRRGEEEGILSIDISIEVERGVDALDRIYLRGLPEAKEQVEQAISDSYDRLLKPSIETEFSNISKQRADSEAIKIFATNLRQLLLASPLGQKRVLGIDPGFRTGCKTVCLNEQGDLLFDTVIYPMDKKIEAEAVVKKLILEYRIDAIAIGNGTASRETEAFIKNLIKASNGLLKVAVHVVSEQGASIYSASPIARDEFPNKDVTVRGAISIARRLMDPLAELVKIDPKSIGVGQYQHDVEQKMLKESLDSVVESCVNLVGVELNTASKHLLSYVSGLGPSLAQNIVEYRAKNGAFSSREELKKVPRLGAKAFEQCAGFLRIRGAENPLDNSAVHPETYAIVQKMAKDLGVKVSELIGNEQLKSKIVLKNYVTETVGIPTLNDILSELQKPGRDPREALEAFEFSADVHSMEDLKVGMILPGIVTNITAFGCFVDIGVHQDGLVHVSQMSNKFIKDPNEVVKVHQKVQVKVMEVDIPRKRIGLSMKF